jgi:hypothetical protein
MRGVLEGIGRVIFWTYQRGSWQYDVLCALILAFIFLTPKEYFARPPFYTGEDPMRQEQQQEKRETTGKTELRLPEPCR